MNSYKRVICALSLKKPDIIPIVEPAVHPDILGKLEPGISEQEFMAKYLDAIVVGQNTQEKEGNDGFVDEWGIKRKYTGEKYAIPVRHPVQSKGDLRTYNPPDPSKDYRLSSLKQVVEKYKGKKAIIFPLETVFTYAWGLVGMENLLVFYKTDPLFARKVSDISFNYHLELAKNAIKEGADIIWCGDDLAYKSGLIISPEDFKQFVLPYLKKMVAQVHQMGAWFVKHSDGNIWKIMDFLVGVGVDAINPLEPAAGMNISKVKKRYGKKMCLIGNIDCGDVLSWSSPQEVKDVVKQTIGKAAPGGGYIMSSSGMLHSSVKPQNYKTMIKSTREYGEYSGS